MWRGGSARAAPTHATIAFGIGAGDEGAGREGEAREFVARNAAAAAAAAKSAAAAAAAAAAAHDTNDVDNMGMGGAPADDAAAADGAAGWGGSLSAHYGVSVPLSLHFEFAHGFLAALLRAALLYALPVCLLALGGLGMEAADADPLGLVYTTLGNLGLSDELRADALAAAPASSALALRELRRLHNRTAATARCHLPRRAAACAAEAAAEAAADATAGWAWGAPLGLGVVGERWEWGFLPATASFASARAASAVPPAAATYAVALVRRPLATTTD